MDRHDTHLLSEESELKEKEEDAHQLMNLYIYLMIQRTDWYQKNQSIIALYI